MCNQIRTRGMIRIGVIPIDSIYTPITRVNFGVENTRVGQVTTMTNLLSKCGRMAVFGQKKL